jgi:hypothetical protein
MTTVDDCFAAPQQAGWSLGEVQLQMSDGRRLWQVDCANGENQILARAPTQAEAWFRPREQVRVVGMLGLRP